MLFQTTPTKQERKEMRLLFAAFTFLHHTRDGLEISTLINVSPITLHQWTDPIRDDWIHALRYWRVDYKAPTEIQGEAYHAEVETERTRRHFKYTERLWLEALGLKNETAELRKYRARFSESNEVHDD